VSDSAVDIRPVDLGRVWAALDPVLPGSAAVWVFGSRAQGRARAASDLDLAIDAGRPLSREEATALHEVFEESDLPYTVDVVDLCSTSPSFRALIERDRQALPRVR
jgi:predicted nucleotidyltransferase